MDLNLRINIPYENLDYDTEKELRFLDRKIHEYKAKLMYYESKDCRECFLKETIDENRRLTTERFRILIDAKQDLLKKIKKKFNLLNKKEFNSMDKDESDEEESDEDENEDNDKEDDKLNLIDKIYKKNEFNSLDKDEFSLLDNNELDD